MKCRPTTTSLGEVMVNDRKTGCWRTACNTLCSTAFFGGKKLPQLIRGVGDAVKEFKKGMKNKYAITWKDCSLPVRLQENSDKYMPYLLEIRKRLFFLSAIFATASSAVGFFYYERVIFLLLRRFQNDRGKHRFYFTFQYINLAINSAFLVGLFVVFPLFIYQLLSFLKPALTKSEYQDYNHTDSNEHRSFRKPDSRSG
jgi:hypothetical protein